MPHFGAFLENALKWGILLWRSLWKLWWSYDFFDTRNRLEITFYLQRGLKNIIMEEGWNKKSKERPKGVK